MKKSIIAAAIVIVLIFAGLVFDFGRAPMISTFDECVAAGFPVMESYPPRCTSGDGKTFSLPLASRQSKAALIELFDLRDGAEISSPLILSGRARGPWYFEASFPIELVSSNGEVLAQAVAQADGDWMTSEFVPFSAEIKFASTTSGPAHLVLRKDNPSGMVEFDDALVIPVVLK